MKLGVFLLLLLGVLISCTQSQNVYKELKPIIVSKSNQVIKDSDLKVEIYFNRKITHTIKADFGADFDGKIIIDKEKVTITKKCTSIGMHNLKGKILFFDGQTLIHSVIIDYGYFVVPVSALVINSDLSNKLILNKENNISISVSGFPSTMLSATSDNGQISKKSSGNYKITPNKKGSCRVKIFIKKGNELVLVKTEEFEVVEFL